MNTIFINHEPVELYKILKFECLVDGGGEAKTVITQGYVTVNGTVERQKRKKIHSGDIIEFNGESYRIELDEGSRQVSAEKTKPASSKATPNKPKKRSAIAF